MAFSGLTSPMKSMFSPVASAAPVASSGVNPSTGAYYTGLQKPPAAGTSTTPTLNTPALAPALTSPYAGNDDSGTNGYNTGQFYAGGEQPGTRPDGTIYTGPVSAGNGTFGALGTNAPSNGIGNTSGGVGPAPGTADSAASGAAAAAAAEGAAAPAPTYGSESGPGIMDQWFNERATGADPGWEYATKRAGTALDNAYSARGGYNSGAALQGQGDMLSSAISGREGQLDALAGGASSERANALATMFGLGTGLAGGEAGLGGLYDTGAASAMSGANSSGLSAGMSAGMIPYLANQGLLSSLFGL